MGLHFKENEEKITLGMIITGIVCIAVLLSILIVYFINTASSNNNKDIPDTKIVGDLEEEKESDFETVSIDIGKGIEEATNELNNVITNNTVSKNTLNTNSNIVNTNTVTTSTNVTNTDITKGTQKKETKSIEEEKVEPKEETKFLAPIKGEIIREFAPDSLVYSNTLEEWITHNGVDIKADKTSVVIAAAKGTVDSIKNDPRYGITVIVTHENGYKTLYANLLTAEYVVEGEEIEAGQTIGTIGNTASFEVADEYHLHFELLKDDDYVNPGNYMSFE